jgi:oligopeptide transport system permease protein
MSFLGLGVPPPFPSLGNMIQEGLGALRYYPWRLLIPAFVIFTLVFVLFSLVDRLKKRMHKYL